MEEFESGGKPMEGVGTSTAGFIGLAERGPVEGIPQLITNFADFKRTYGGYLSENEFGEYRFLAYAVEHFFINGGSRCFVMRVAPQDAKCAEGYAPAKEKAAVRFAAKNPGIWGDDIRVVVTPSSKAKTQILEILDTADGKKYLVKNGAGFQPGDVVMYADKTEAVYNKVVKNQDNVITFAKEFGDGVVDRNLLPTKVITTCEFTLEVKYNDQVELYENVSFNISAPNYLDKKVAKSDLIMAQYVGKETAEPQPPFAGFLAEDIENPAIVTVSFDGGSNGSVANISAADFIGSDNGAANGRASRRFWTTMWCRSLRFPA